MMSIDISMKLSDDEDRGGVLAVNSDDDKMWTQGDKTKTDEVTSGEVVCSFKQGMCVVGVRMGSSWHWL